MNRTLNFYAGPATLPLPALERAKNEIPDWEGTGMSVMETSHRSPEYDVVHHEAMDLVSELLQPEAFTDFNHFHGATLFGIAITGAPLSRNRHTLSLFAA